MWEKYTSKLLAEGSDAFEKVGEVNCSTWWHLCAIYELLGRLSGFWTTVQAVELDRFWSFERNIIEKIDRSLPPTDGIAVYRPAFIDCWWSLYRQSDINWSINPVQSYYICPYIFLATILFYFSTKYNFYSTISISTIFYFLKNTK